MPKWFRCRVCEAKDDEIRRVYAELNKAQTEIRTLTDKLLAKNDPVTHRVVNPPERRQRPVDVGIPPFARSLQNGGHLRMSLEEIRRDPQIVLGDAG